MNRIVLLVIMSLVAAPFGCRKTPQKAAEIPEITSRSEEGFVDLVFAITDTQIEQGKSSSLTARGAHKNETVGLRVVLHST